ncbi:MAG TPA: menaquinone biosynthesis protein [Candidatus Krumholzibacteria bacterium]|nr:menaquinone biosynthesis protein [Candidatus Krumholzibacteria bacterium]
MTEVRIGAVSYLNARPLVHGLQSNAEYSLCFDTPGVLSEKLRLGEIDVGLIPIVEFLRGVGESILPGICIASNGPVHTVKLYSKVTPEKLGRVAVDSGSRTSVALLRILLAERYGVTPDFHTFRPDLREMLRTHDAALLIGDAAFAGADVLQTWDLGAGWQELTSLPFVYAVWTLRPGLDVTRISSWLTSAMQSGVRHVDTIARDAAQSMGRDETMLRHYLGTSLHYTLGEREIHGIEAFQRLCLRYNMVSSARKLVLAGPVPAATTAAPVGHDK